MQEGQLVRDRPDDQGTNLQVLTTPYSVLDLGPYGTEGGQSTNQDAEQMPSQIHHNRDINHGLLVVQTCTWFSQYT